MKIAVAGGTGLVGGELVRQLEATGDDVVVLARSVGINVESGEGLDQALTGVDTVVDVLNTPAESRDDVVNFFTRASETLLAAERRAGVRHHVQLSIIGVDKTRDYAHFAGKVAQEKTVAAAGIPFTIVRASQFFEFAEMSVEWGLSNDRSSVPPLLMQPISVSDAATFLGEFAHADPIDGVVEIAGPERHDLVDVARRTLNARGRSLTLDPSWIESGAGTELAGNLLLPGEGARIATGTLQGWLDQLRPGGR